MSGGFYGSNDSKLSSKAGALEFAVAINTASDGNGRAVVDYDEAQKLFDFICKNVRLPEVGRDSMETLSEGYANLLDTLVKELGSRKVIEKEVSKA